MAETVIGFSNEELAAVLSVLYRFHSFDKLLKLPSKLLLIYIYIKRYFYFKNLLLFEGIHSKKLVLDDIVGQNTLLKLPDELNELFNYGM